MVFKLRGSGRREAVKPGAGRAYLSVYIPGKTTFPPPCLPAKKPETPEKQTPGCRSLLTVRTLTFANQSSASPLPPRGSTGRMLRDHRSPEPRVRAQRDGDESQRIHKQRSFYLKQIKKPPFLFYGFVFLYFFRYVLSWIHDYPHLAQVPGVGCQRLLIDGSDGPERVMSTP